MSKTTKSPRCQGMLRSVAHPPGVARGANPRPGGTHRTSYRPGPLSPALTHEPTSGVRSRITNCDLAKTTTHSFRITRRKLFQRVICLGPYPGPSGKIRTTCGGACNPTIFTFPIWLSPLSVSCTSRRNGSQVNPLRSTQFRGQPSILHSTLVGIATLR